MSIHLHFTDESLDAIASAVANRVLEKLDAHLKAAPSEGDPEALKAAADKAKADADKAAKAKAAKEAKAKKEAEEAAKAAAAETLAAEDGTEEAAGNVEVTKEEATAKMAEFRRKHGIPEVTALVSKYADKFINVKPADYAALLADAEARDAELSAKDDLDF